MSYRYRQSYRSRQSTCGRCGVTTYKDVHDHFPECSDSCSEWLVDARHLDQDDWADIERDRY